MYAGAHTMCGARGVCMSARFSHPTDQPQRNLRDQRFNMRMSSQQRYLIGRAAAALDKTETDFMLEVTTSAAERVLTDRRWFALDEEAWSQFDGLLDAPADLLKGGSPREVPCLLMGRLAVTSDEQGRHLGKSLLIDGLLRAVRLSNEVGFRALLIHARDDTARSWYLHQARSFQTSPT